MALDRMAAGSATSRRAQPTTTRGKGYVDRWFSSHDKNHSERRADNRVWLMAGAALSQPPFGSPPQPRPDATLAAAPAGSTRGAKAVPAGLVEHIEFDSKVTGGKRPASVYLPPGYSRGQEIPRALSAARHRRQRDALAGPRRRRRDPRQSDCRRQSRADDRRDAERARVERAVDALRRRSGAAARAAVRPAQPGAAGGPARARRRRCVGAVGRRRPRTAPPWPWSSRHTRRSSAS